MNKLKQRFSIQEGFIPNSRIEAGNEYHAHDITNPSSEPFRVFIDAINENVDGYFDVQLTYESDRSTDFWSLRKDDKVFKVYKNQIKEEKKSVKILGLEKKSLNESDNIHYKVKLRKQPKIQIGDEVIYDKKRGSIIGAIGEKWIVQCQYSTYTVIEKELTSLKEKGEIYGLDQFKFSDKTQALLFEQMVRCGIFMKSTPIKTTGCHVKYSEWKKADSEDPIRVLIENSTKLFPKNQVQILEDVNSFASPDNFIEGVIVDENTGEATENIMINVEDYTDIHGDAGPVRVLRKNEDGEDMTDTLPKALLKTLSV